MRENWLEHTPVPVEDRMTDVRVILRTIKIHRRQSPHICSGYPPRHCYGASAARRGGRLLDPGGAP